MYVTYNYINCTFSYVSKIIILYNTFYEHTNLFVTFIIQLCIRYIYNINKSYDFNIFYVCMFNNATLPEVFFRLINIF